ncbi:MAG: short chain dehydrogenase [Moraxellaceae bacterium]|nr:MAG: short chain dehydrogenase [Moraxellaceae bacterium]
MTTPNNKRIAITGAASGLGKAIALCYAKAGWNVAVADILDDDGIQVTTAIKALGVDSIFCHCDVTSDADIKHLHDLVLDRWGGLDVIVNNAGVATHGPIDSAPIEDWQWCIDINLMGVVRGCKQFTQLFKQQGYGHIVNVASIAGLIYSPEMGSYNAAKAANVALSETLRYELEPYNIYTSVVCPGFFQTNLAKNVRSPDAGAQQFIDRLLSQSKINADDIATMIFTAVEKKQFWILPHRSYKNIWLFKRYIPFIYQRIFGTMGQKTKHKRDKATKT